MEYFRAMLREDFDLAGAAPFVLGPHWRTATPAERQEFIRLLDDYIVVTFGRRLVGYGGISLRVIGNRGTQSEPIVITEIERPGAAPVKLEWRLSANSGAYRVTDLVLDGVSMAATQHDEFAAILQRTGGTVAGLLLMMRQIIASGGP